MSAPTDTRLRELDQLSPDHRAVLSLVLLQDRSYAEVATMLGMSEQAVRERAHAALDALAAGSSPPPSASSVGSRTSASSVGSRRAGALLLAAIAAVVVVAGLLISGAVGGKGSGQPKPASTSATNSAGSTHKSVLSAAAPKTDKVLALTPVEASLKAAGVAYVFSDAGKHAFYLAAQGLPANSSGAFYAVWLYNSPTSVAPLGRAPAVDARGRTEGGGPLPPNAGIYHKMVVTRETDPHATHPGEIVLSGAFALH